MRILHIHFDPPSNSYGTGNFYRKITEQLNKKNALGTNICCDRYDADTFYQSNIIYASKRVKRRVVLLTYLYELICLELKSFFYLINNKKKYDLIISYHDGGLLAYFLSKYYKKKYIKFFFHLHETYCELFYKEKNLYENKLKDKFTLKKKINDLLSLIENNFRIFNEKFFLNNIDILITCLQETKKTILNYKKIIKKKNTTIKVLPFLFEKKIDVKNINNKKKNILMHSSSLYHKGFVRFLEIITLNNFHLTTIYNIKIIGLTDMVTAKKYIKFFKLENKIKIYGFVGKNINKYYKESDILINLSLIEGWGISITDAYLSKKIIISSKVGCINEIFQNNKNVFSIDRNNNDECYKKLIEIHHSNVKFRIDKKFYLIKKKLFNKLAINNYINFFKSTLKI